MGRAVGRNALIEQRIGAAEGLADADAHALAGFLDAEGCFQVGPNNRARTWSCYMTVAVRDDDANLLTDLCRVTGLGRVRAKRAQATRARRRAGPSPASASAPCWRGSCARFHCAPASAATSRSGLVRWIAGPPTRTTRRLTIPCPDGRRCRRASSRAALCQVAPACARRPVRTAGRPTSAASSRRRLVRVEWAEAPRRRQAAGRRRPSGSSSLFAEALRLSGTPRSSPLPSGNPNPMATLGSSVPGG